MIADKKVLALIPARGGSKGLPGKNVRLLGGKPLLAWSVQAAKASKYVDRIVLSSDDAEIMAVARAAGCDVPFTRPADFATDSAGVQDVVIHALDSLGEAFDYVVLLQPTSPLRSAADMDACIEACVAAGAPSCVSVTRPAKSPYWMFFLDEDGTGHPVLGDDNTGKRRQELRQAYVLNGAVYVVEVARFRESLTFVGPQTRFHVMPEERSCDIDTLLDFSVAETLVASRLLGDDANSDR